MSSQAAVRPAGPAPMITTSSRSASLAILTRSSRVSSRNLSMRAFRAAARASGEVPAASSTSGSETTTRISSLSALTSTGPALHSLGRRDWNQPLISWIIAITTLLDLCRVRSTSGGSLLGLRAQELELVHHHLGLVALLACGGVVPRAVAQPPLYEEELALVEVGPRGLSLLAEDDQVVEVGVLPGGAVLCFACVDVGGQPDGRHVRARLGRADLGF